MLCFLRHHRRLPSQQAFILPSLARTLALLPAGNGRASARPFLRREPRLHNGVGLRIPGKRKREIQQKDNMKYLLMVLAAVAMIGGERGSAQRRRCCNSGACCRRIAHAPNTTPDKK
jgi:hypothetical protein